MPVKHMNILDTLHLIAGNRSAAHAAPDGYPDTGNFALKWSEYQCIVLKQIKPAQFMSVRRSYNNALVFASVARKLVSPAISALKSRFKSA